MKIYQRIYDNPINKDGTTKGNKLIGDFNIIETIESLDYSSLKLATFKDRVYLIKETEVFGINGGSKFVAIEIKSGVLKL